MSELKITIRHGSKFPTTAIDWVVTEELFLFFKDNPELLGREIIEKIEEIGFPPPKPRGESERDDRNGDFVMIPCC